MLLEQSPLIGQLASLDLGAMQSGCNPVRITGPKFGVSAATVALSGCFATAQAASLACM
jgi:hypothetical protein